jgi:hypothetical protein
MTQMRAAYSPVNQAWFVLYGREGAPIERWSVISVGDSMVWPGGRRQGRRLLAAELTRLGLRFAAGDPDRIVCAGPAEPKE